eukprot:TRINITY_DN8925_c0_g1_i5.p3 TRINITY_DN8925_c0_g1~~TRINITY_DN8925_c0_g1_i5.p3  ORF type:complete len:265 (-),score=-10.94 TRINITY_DN8925_c0_g1_i5:265-1059(-)
MYEVVFRSMGYVQLVMKLKIDIICYCSEFKLTGTIYALTRFNIKKQCIYTSQYIINQLSKQVPKRTQNQKQISHIIVRNFTRTYQCILWIAFQQTYYCILWIAFKANTLVIDIMYYCSEFKLAYQCIIQLTFEADTKEDSVWQSLLQNLIKVVYVARIFVVFKLLYPYFRFQATLPYCSKRSLRLNIFNCITIQLFYFITKKIMFNIVSKQDTRHTKASMKNKNVLDQFSNLPRLVMIQLYSFVRYGIDDGVMIVLTMQGGDFL